MLGVSSRPYSSTALSATALTCSKSEVSARTAMTEPPASPYLVHQGAEPLLVAGGYHHLCTPVCEAQGRLAAYTAGCSHQRHDLLFDWL